MGKKSVNNLYKPMLEHSNVEQKFHKAAKGKKDAEQETEERATANTLMMTKLENIADDVKDIKRDYKETRAEVQNLHDRVLIVEQSLKSYHKRLDGMNLNIKTDQ